MRTLARLIGTLVLVASVWRGLPADAQAFLPPPIRPAVDANGVELVSGRPHLPTTDFTIGVPGAGGLSFGLEIWSRQHPYTGAVITQTSSTKTTYTVTIGSNAESFDKNHSPSNSPFVSVQGRGSTLTQTSTTFTYTSPEGAVAVFSKNLTNVNGAAAGYITSLTLPDGEIRTYHHVSQTTPPATRLQSITNNRGYQIKLLYAGAYWQQITGAIGINMAVDYCDPLAATCTGLTQSWPSATYDSLVYDLTVTDHAGNVTEYENVFAYGDPMTIRLPGSLSDDIVYTFEHVNGTVSSVNRNGRIWTYALSWTATELTTVVTDPANRQSTYVFDAATRSIKRFTNTAGELTTYINDAKGRPTDVTLPTGEILRYQYDVRGNLGQINKVSSPPGSPDLVWRAVFDSSCSAPKKCNKPNWTMDPAGNQTDTSTAPRTGA